jgi:hypothetical protein
VMLSNTWACNLAADKCFFLVKTVVLKQKSQTWQALGGRSNPASSTLPTPSPT